MTLPDGQVVRLHGYADRLELDEDGRVVVVDLKTGKYRARPTRRSSGTRQLGLYQLAVDHGAADELGRPPGDLGWRRAGPAAASATTLPEGPGTSRAAAGDGPRLVEEQLMQAAAALRAEEFVARPGTALRPLHVPGDLPRQGLRDGAVVTPATARHPRAARATCWASTGPSATQQFAAITAPLEPAVVIAGAGSGKTTVMAARVVWLVATGQVAPDEVLGLTFTTKATAELQQRIRDSLRQAGLLPDRRPTARPDDERGRGRGADGRDLPRLRLRRCSPSTACGSATSPTPG